MSKKSIYGILGIVVVLGVLLLLSQTYFNKVNSGNSAATGGGGSGQNSPGQPGEPQKSPASKITEAKLQQNWKALIASAPPPRGPANAAYQVIEIGDFQCPICGKLKPMLEAVMQASNGKAKLYFVNWPLTHIHAQALGAAQAGDAAAAQGKFWPVYDMLYSDQDELQPAYIEAAVRAVPGVDASRLTADMNSRKYLPAVTAQTAVVMQTGTNATPTFLVRSPKGHIDWYVGRIGTKGDKGLNDLAKNPPWGGGMSDEQVQAFVSDSEAS